MASLTTEEVRKVAHLARLELAPDAAENYAVQLSRILELVGQLGAAQTDQVEPMAHPLAMVQRLRVDAVSEPDRRTDYQAHAPSVRDGLYVVPKVIE
ncbi:MAG: Asp-tRNA(Asn)/Glu-tRNA(Gln) amidotransferase subunit GatC [Panacagrimonas sp.]